MTVQFSQMTLLAGKIFLGVGGDEPHQHESDEDGRDGRQGHQHICDEHHKQRAQKQGDSRYQHAYALVKRLGDHVHVVGHAGKNVAVGSPVVIIHRQSVDLLRDVPPHLPGEDLRDGGHDKMLRKGQDDTANVKKYQSASDRRHGLHIYTAFQSPGDDSGQLREFIRSDQCKDGASGRADDSNEDGNSLFTAVSDQLFPCAFKIPGFAASAPPHAGTMHPAVSCRVACIFFLFHYASSSFESCERAIC